MLTDLKSNLASFRKPLKTDTLILEIPTSKMNSYVIDDIELFGDALVIASPTHKWNTPIPFTVDQWNNFYNSDNKENYSILIKTSINYQEEIIEKVYTKEEFEELRDILGMKLYEYLFNWIVDQRHRHSSFRNVAGIQRNCGTDDFQKIYQTFVCNREFCNWAGLSN